ncbi:putative acyltransferase-like protein, chloroplastic [Iris pallida]|uniref:Acyltransferase-like protein, chloroplastic n=1 Tax=Iris pallida TaxID=29817 RepID=A0AAX6EPC5_IRIPA|nr:putative acyltransferase-like protein, chloroplastic [Iris pallida]
MDQRPQQTCTWKYKGWHGRGGCQPRHVFPGVIPKVRGRFYYLFEKPVETRGMGYLKDRDSTNEVYLRIKSDVEGLISYLKTKREEDPYRSIVQRTITQYSLVDPSEVPTFEP